MRKPMMAGNWKMNKTYSEAVVLTQGISNQFERNWGTVDIVLCTPAIDLKPALTVLEFDHSDIKVGAQNVYWEESGAFTGEISVSMLKEIGCTYCIVGHSERRGLFFESDEWVNKKTRALIEGGVAPIVCVGESLSVRDEGGAEEFVRAQIRAAFAGIDVVEMKDVVIAYEPIWAIGTGRTATPEQAQEICAAIRSEISTMFGPECAEATRVLYGGSMNPGNVEELISCEDIDGGLIGGAALQADTFAQLIKAAAAR